MGRPIKSIRRGSTRLRLWSARSLLVLLFAFSIIQYMQRGEVSWLTDSFRWVENSSRSAVADPGAALGQAWGSLTSFIERALHSPGTAITDSQRRGDPVPSAEPGEAPDSALSARVLRVDDGDSLTVRLRGDREVRVRLHGIDAPERGQAFGNAARKALARLVAGRQVSVVEVDVDQYGRLVGVVYVDGVNANLEMVSQGYAWWYRRYAADDRELRRRETEARRERRGLWVEPDPINPEAWRRGRR